MVTSWPADLNQNQNSVSISGWIGLSAELFTSLKILWMNRNEYFADGNRSVKIIELLIQVNFVTELSLFVDHEEN